MGVNYQYGEKHFRFLEIFYKNCKFIYLPETMSKLSLYWRSFTFLEKRGEGGGGGLAPMDAFCHDRYWNIYDN